MKFFLFITCFTAFLHGMVPLLGLEEVTPKAKSTPQFLKSYQANMKERFKRPENANVLFSFITGNKNGISPYTKKAFKRTNLSFLLSPSGLHLSILLTILFYPLNKLKYKTVKRSVKIVLLPCLLFLPEFYSLHRSMLLRMIHQFKFMAKLRLNLEHIFLLTFLLSFLAGHFHNSPMSFIYSFAYLGIFFSLRDYSKTMLIGGLFSIQLVLGLFSGENSSLLSIPFGLLGSFVFSLLFPFFLLFLGSFWLLDWNWGEPLVRAFIVAIQFISKNLQGSFTSPSLFLIVAVLVLMWAKSSRVKYFALAFLLFCHTDIAMTPALWSH